MHYIFQHRIDSLRLAIYLWMVAHRHEERTAHQLEQCLPKVINETRIPIRNNAQRHPPILHHMLEEVLGDYLHRAAHLARDERRILGEMVHHHHDAAEPIHLGQTHNEIHVDAHQRLDWHRQRLQQPVGSPILYFFLLADEVGSNILDNISIHAGPIKTPLQQGQCSMPPKMTHPWGIMALLQDLSPHILVFQHIHLCVLEHQQVVYHIMVQDPSLRHFLLDGIDQTGCLRVHCQALLDQLQQLPAKLNSALSMDTT